MAISVSSSGTTTPTLATETQLAAPTAAGTYALQVDATNLANGEKLTLKLYALVKSGGTLRQCCQIVQLNAPGEPVIQSPPVLSGWGVKATLQQDSGTARAYDWALLKLDGA